MKLHLLFISSSHLALKKFSRHRSLSAAQWRIREAYSREKAIHKRVVSAINSLLGYPWSSHEPSVILRHVVLGSREDAAEHELLYNAGITHVVNCATQVSNYFEGEFVYVKLHLHDTATEDLIPHFQTVAKFLKRVEVLRGRALVHCISGESVRSLARSLGVVLRCGKEGADPGSQGVSRSAALLIAYLMIDKRMRLLDAYNLVRRKRRSVQPNQGFRLQLAKYEVRSRLLI